MESDEQLLSSPWRPRSVRCATLQAEESVRRWLPHQEAYFTRHQSTPVVGVEIISFVNVNPLLSNWWLPGLLEGFVAVPL